MSEKLYRSECVEVACLCLHETEKSLKVQTEKGKHWVPKRYIHEDSEVLVNGDEGLLLVDEWIAKKEEML